MNAIVFDKTGTLTEGTCRGAGCWRTVEWPRCAGKMVCTDVHFVAVSGAEEAELWRLVGGAETASEHPISRAIRARALTCIGASAVLPTATSAEAVPGRGLRAAVDGRMLLGPGSEGCQGINCVLRFLV